MSLLLAVLLALGLVQGSDQPREVVRQARANFQRNNSVADQYNYKERQVRRYLDGQGRVIRTDIATYDVTRIAGTPWKRLIARNDRPLSPGEERSEQQRVNDEIRKRHNETPDQRAKRLREYQKKKQEREDTAREVLDAFNFEAAGQETVNGFPCQIIAATPRPGYVPHGRIGGILPHLSARLWITTGSNELVKQEANVLESISFGWFLARLDKGGRIIIEQTRVNNEVWLPSRFSLKLDYRAVFKLFRKTNIEQENTFFDYKKFTVDSKVTPLPEARP